MTNSPRRLTSKFRRFIGWTFSIVFAVFGLLILTETILLGLCFVILSTMAAPPVRAWTYSRFPHTLPSDINITMIGVFIAMSLVTANLAPNDQEVKTAHFKAEQSAIMADLQQAYDQKAYEDVLSKAEPYLFIKDSELTALYNNAQKENERIQEEKERIHRKATTDAIVANLKTIPAAQIERNRALYARLVTLNPDVKAYQDKLAHYTAKVQEKRAKERAEKEQRRMAHEARVARFGGRPEQSSWDGSYLPVATYLNQVAHDPDSVEFVGCTQVNYTDDGWLVGCNYRARNGFGGLILQSNWFTIRHGTVVSMHDSGAFRSLN